MSESRPSYGIQMDEDRRIEPARLSSVLGVPVDAVDVLDESSGSANRLRLRLTYGGDSGGLPEQMFLKRNLARFSFPEEMYSTEVRIYRDVLPALDVEQPVLYGVDASDDDIRFWILMEDLGLRPRTRLGYVLDPTTPDEVDGLLDTLARIHAAWWDGERLSRELPWALPPTQNAQMQFWAGVGPKLTRHNLEISAHRIPLVDTQKWPQENWWPAFRRLIANNSEPPHTLLHGDVHASNVYYVTGGPGGILDWQMALRGRWALDVAYIISTALTVEDRQATESDLLRGYLDRLTARGVAAPTFDEAWDRYRENMLYGVLMWLITPDGVHTDEAQACFLERCLTATDDLDTMETLQA